VNLACNSKSSLLSKTGSKRSRFYLPPCLVFSHFIVRVPSENNFFRLKKSFGMQSSQFHRQSNLCPVLVYVIKQSSDLPHSNFHHRRLICCQIWIKQCSFCPPGEPIHQLSIPKFPADCGLHCAAVLIEQFPFPIVVNLAVHHRNDDATGESQFHSRKSARGGFAIPLDRDIPASVGHFLCVLGASLRPRSHPPVWIRMPALILPPGIAVGATPTLALAFSFEAVVTSQLCVRRNRSFGVNASHLEGRGR